MIPTPWYKQFWPWFLLILPLCAVIASIYTFQLAHRAQFHVVSEDYIKQGKGISQDLSRQQHAQQLALRFEITHQVHSSGDRFIIRQHAGGIYSNALQLRLIHPTLPEQDQQQLLTADGDGAYRFNSTETLSGHWRLEIASYDNRWALAQTVQLPLSTSLWLE